MDSPNKTTLHKGIGRGFSKSNLYLFVLFYFMLAIQTFSNHWLENLKLQSMKTFNPTMPSPFGYGYEG